MQHRRKQKPWIFVGAAALLVAGFVFLLYKNVPAPQTHIEKPLDASKFLKVKE